MDVHLEVHPGEWGELELHKPVEQVLEGELIGVAVVEVIGGQDVEEGMAGTVVRVASPEATLMPVRSHGVNGSVVSWYPNSPMKAQASWSSARSR
jgi:hypothetical protein